MKILRAPDYRSMPWKNGAGTTIEIAVFPAHASMENFIWRVSRAQVVADGGFSHFADIDRSLALLEGEGMRIQIGAHQLQVDQRNNIVSFAGDVPLHAELLNGAISDFNLMSRRSFCQHKLTHWIGAANRQLADDIVLLYCAQGSGELITGTATQQLCANETVLFSDDDTLSDIRLHCADHSRFYCVQIQTL
jgi:environmental stress-induced protein Ves